MEILRLSRRPSNMRTLLATFALGSSLLVSSIAHADQLVIKYPGDHPAYSFEAEPHVLIGFFDPPGRFGRPGRFGGGGFGPGFRGTIEIVDNGFIRSINNTVGIGFGADFLLGDGTAVWVPVVMQWNFWLSQNWSLFGEPGLGIYLGDAKGVRPAFYAGGRYHFTDAIALTMRLGHPHFSIGVSFLL